MKHRKPQPGEPDAIKTKWFSLSFRGIICLLILVCIIGIFSVLIFNIGYNQKTGWYWKPNNLEVHIKKQNKE